MGGEKAVPIVLVIYIACYQLNKIYIYVLSCE